ncbi:hypothetical protein [Dialister invisus]|uniref:hypothetical protein n=1 Tax=Dialister invisus TaxID=218538 RepID=UPI003FD8FD24
MEERVLHRNEYYYDGYLVDLYNEKDELVDVLLTDQYAACVFQNQDGGWVKMYDQRESW